jgi:hypothetical protein
VFGTDSSRALILSRRPILLTEGFSTYAQFLHANAEKIPYIRPGPFPSASFPFSYSSESFSRDTGFSAAGSIVKNKNNTLMDDDDDDDDNDDKVKEEHFILEQAITAHRGRRGKLHLLFNLGARGGWVVNVTPRPL